jgi:ACS family tartrate transporter-like MFS transporter
MSDRQTAENIPVVVAAPPPANVTEARVMLTVSLRLIPFLFLLYVVNILDRVNVGFARLQMLEQLGLSEVVYGLGAGIFYVGYFVFEVPSNLILRRVGARVWIGRILISWGIISCAMMFVIDQWSFYLLRFLLGVAEAGFFPGMILYLSYWFPARQRARAVSFFITASAVAGIVGFPVSGLILEYLDQFAGLAGWKWLFLLEGLPAVALGVASLLYLTDRPELAGWLAPAERAWLAGRMRGEEQHRATRHGLTLLRAAANPAVWLLCALYFTVAMGANGFGLYLPKILDDQFPDLNRFHLGLLAAVPNVAAIVTMVLVGAHSDRTGERRWHVAGPAFAAACGWLLVAAVGWGLVPAEYSGVLALVGLAVTQAATLSILAPFWSLPTSFLSGAAAAGGIAFINSVGNLGGFAGPAVISWVKEATDSFSGGMLFLAAALVLGGVLALCAPHDATLERRG